MHFVYMLISRDPHRHSYVGYTNNLNKRLDMHNSSKGAKYTRGRKWLMIYSKKYKKKSEALIEEYKLKKNYLLRKKLKEKFNQAN